MNRKLFFAFLMLLFASCGRTIKTSYVSKGAFEDLILEVYEDNSAVFVMSNEEHLSYFDGKAVFNDSTHEIFFETSTGIHINQSGCRRADAYSMNDKLSFNRQTTGYGIELVETDIKPEKPAERSGLIQAYSSPSKDEHEALFKLNDLENKPEIRLRYMMPNEYFCLLPARTLKFRLGTQGNEIVDIGITNFDDLISP